ncbi:MAG: endonuclease/exonuclease/phosphatase family protein [Opitutae bacterium]|nr:endonuclease/exonuclease/phosphatase family protein [Opitutae bacterium]
MRCFFALVLLASAGWARPFTVAVYNLENLFDIDGVAVYDEYQPASYRPAHLNTKLRHAAEVMARIGDNGRGPDVILFQELEVDRTPESTMGDQAEFLRKYAGTTFEKMLAAPLAPEVAGLPTEAWLLKALHDRGLTGYTVVVGSDAAAWGHEDGNPRAIKCAVFTRFPVKSVRQHPIPNARNIVEVLLDVDGHPLTVFANHWKSGAGDPVTEKIRQADAQVLRARLDELLHADPHADILIGGDFNSQYNQKQRYPEMKQTGLNDVLRSQGNELAIRGPQRDLYNLWYELPAEERGSDVYRGEWGTLIQLIVTRGLYDFRGVQYVDNSFAVAKFAGLNQAADGTPIRWSSEGTAGAGYSDHFPISARFVTVDANQPDRWLALQRASDGNAPAAGPRVKRIAVDVEKTALTEAQLPAGANLRDGSFNGKLFRVTGKVTLGARPSVAFRGESYELYAPDPAVREKLRAAWTDGAEGKFYGELGQYKGRWQFVIRESDWLK